MAKKKITPIKPIIVGKKYKVSGQVFNSNSEPVSGQNVLTADVDLRGAAIYKTAKTISELKENDGFDFLSPLPITKIKTDPAKKIITASTNENGYYEINFDASSYGRSEIGLADVVVFAIDGDNIIARSKLATTKDYINNTELQHLDIYLPTTDKRGLSEYARLMQIVDPFMKESGLQLFQLSGSDDQINFLAIETNQDLTHISLAVQADKLRSDYLKNEFSAELFYGIGRQNITLSWVSLLLKKASDLAAAIQKSIDQNIISPQDKERIKIFVENIMNVALEHSANVPETASLYKTIGFAIKDPALQKSLVQSYMQFSGKPEDFWKELSQKKDFTDFIKPLQLTNQLSLLTGQHAALIEELQVNKNIKDPSDLLRLTSDDWNKMIKSTGVPDSVPGNTPEEKASAYISGMQNLLNAAYPTQKIALMVKNNQLHFDDANIKEKISAFFAAVPNFDISTSRITDFKKQIEEVSGKNSEQVLKHLQLIQRIYQVSPTPEAMNTLIQKGYTSAYHISSFSQNAFVQMEAKNLGGVDIAYSIYNRARHQVMRAQHSILKVRDTLDKATPLKIISSEQQNAINDFINKMNA